MTTGNSLRKGILRGLALVLIAGLCSIAARAAESTPDTPWGVEQLMQRLAQVKNLKGRFVERKHLRILNAPLEFSGTLVYAAPAHLEKHTLLPKPQSLVLDQDQLVVEDKTKKQRRVLKLQEYPVIWAAVESIRATLAGDLLALNRFYRVDLEGRENQWRLLLRPTDPKLGALLSAIRIGGQGTSVRTIEIVEAEGDRSVMTITEEPQ
jgi:hypothetical protein